MSMPSTETVCLWNYDYKTDENSPSSPMSDLSPAKDAMGSTPYLTCTDRSACKDETSPKATFYCVQCNALQCTSCEHKVHEHSETRKHQRMNLDEIDDERCSVDGEHPAVFHCPTCAASFCYSCYESQHAPSDGGTHRARKCRERQILTTQKTSDQYRLESKPITITSSSNSHKNGSPHVNGRTSTPKQSGSSFEDVKVDDSDSSPSSPPTRKEQPMKPKTSDPAGPHHHKRPHHIPEQHNLDQQMLLESMLDQGDEDHTDNHRATKHHPRLSQKSQSKADSDGVFLLLDGNERLTLNNDDDFARQLHASSKDLSVKCVSIIGNTGDGKSFTLNQVFFSGHDKFSTSSTSDSCTMGVWSALDEHKRTLVLDTEGRLGLSLNDNIRNRLLLKILCISDILIYRTRAPKLPNDMFQFLSDASNAFLKYFRKELESVMKTCKVDGPISTMGPTLVVFHETQHTEVLRDHFQCQKTAVEQLKERFDKMQLSYDAYNSIEYVGIQTLGGKTTDFSELKATITAILENNKIRSPRRLSTVFTALKALNEKFNHKIPPEMPSTLPDDFFACSDKCLACGAKCTMTANHFKDNIPHHCDKRCSYNKELDNEVWKCLRCQREGRDIIVYGKLITKGDSLVQGLLKYMWSGFVIECPYHGEIYRSRKHWYGNNEPKDVTRVEVIHVWREDDTSRLASDVTPRKFIELIVYAGSYLSAPTKMLTEMVADQVAPSYWIPNKDVHKCSSCDLQFGSDYSKHHCRACGHVFCDTCTTNRRVVQWIDTENPVRVCNHCYGNPKSRPPSSTSNSSASSSSFDKEKQLNRRTKANSYETGSSADSGSIASSGEHLSELCLTPTDIFDIDQPGAGSVTVEIPATRRVYETVISGLEKIGANYPIELIKESTRPNYWRPDSECRACINCNSAFNNTTNRLHHCRNCGEGVCEQCSPNKRAVPERDWLTPVRVCKLCEQTMNEASSERK